MDNYLIDIINRMLDKSDHNMGPGYVSSKTISWKALREAENIENTDYIAQLILFIDNEKDKNKRDKAYFLLGHIAKNTKSIDATNFLISRIDKEKDKHIISSLLDRIAYLEKPLGTDLTPIINSIKTNTWQIRHSAITALNLSADKIAEKTLIEIIKNSSDEYDLSYSNSTLSKIGSKECIPALLQLINHKKQDVSGSALNAILNLSDNSFLDLFSEQLEKGKNKFIALLGVIKYGNQQVIPYLIKRVKQLVSKRRTIMTTGSDGKTEIIIAMEFLIEYPDKSPEVKNLYELLLTKKYDLLWDNEKEWLNKNKI